MAVTARYRLFALLLIALAGCEFPRDADGTLQRVLAEGAITVGYSQRPPWVIATEDQPGGVEPRLVERWAAHLEVEVRWVQGSESTLLRALEERRIDVMIGGLTADLDWHRQVGQTLPFYEAKLVVAVPADEDAAHARSHWRGRRISHPASRPDFAAHIATIGALPHADGAIGDGPRAIYGFEAAPLGQVATETVLHTERLVMLVPPGESAFLLALDRFLAGARRQGLVP